jgi:hypothetical protein
MNSITPAPKFERYAALKRAPAPAKQIEIQPLFLVAILLKFDVSKTVGTQEAENDIENENEHEE